MGSFLGNKVPGVIPGRAECLWAKAFCSGESIQPNLEVDTMSSNNCGAGELRKRLSKYVPPINNNASMAAARLTKVDRSSPYVGKRLNRGIKGRVNEEP